MKAVVLLSGGIDSSTSLAIAKSRGFDIYAITFDYKQRHKRELESAKMIASALGVKKHLFIKFDLSEIGGSALTTAIEVPKSNLTSDLESGSIIPVTYVPARNTIFLSFALAWAEVIGSGDIFIGANAVDYSGYPDCRPEYIRAFENMANLATKISVEGKVRFKIHAPLISMSKAEIIKEGIKLGLDYSLTWSCYDPQPVKNKKQKTKFKIQNIKTQDSRFKIQNPEFIPCGKCDSCIFRHKGFAEAGIKDPLLEK